MKKLLLLIAVSFVTVCATDYTEELISKYSEALESGVSINQVYADQKAANEKRRVEGRAHQCNGRHFLQPDEDSVTGRLYAEIEADYTERSAINDDLFEGYKNNFDFENELTRKTYLMYELYLRGLERCGKDKVCLLRHDNLKWEEISALGFIEQQCSPVYDPAVRWGKVALTKEQKEKLAETDPNIKELVAKLSEAKQKVQDKINVLNK